MTKMIILTGDETKTEIKKKLQIANIPFVGADLKKTLIEKVEQYNVDLFTARKAEVKKAELIEKKISGEIYCDLKGYRDRVKFFILKKYKGEIKTEADWKACLYKDGL